MHATAASRGEDSAPLGILAGGSGVPVELAVAVMSHGRTVHIVGLEGEAEPEIGAFPHTWVNWGGIGAMIRAFRNAGCRQIVIVGRVRRPNLARLRPDLGFWTSLPALLPFLRGGDDAILRLVVGFFERHGLEVVGAHEAAPELLASEGVLGTRAPGNDELAAIRMGATALIALGPLDAAQAAVSTPDAVLAIEGADGTDAMLRRLAAMRFASAPGTGPAVLIKLPKPHQERRIDLPAIGPETVVRARDAGLTGIAVRDGETLIAERETVIRQSNVNGVFLVGLGASDLANIEPGQAASAVAAGKSRMAALAPVGRHRPRAGERVDAELAAGVLAALEPYWGLGSSVVSRGYVLATEAAGGALAAASRAGGFGRRSCCYRQGYRPPPSRHYNQSWFQDYRYTFWYSCRRFQISIRDSLGRKLRPSP